jgi:hypothetical protein
MFYKLKLFICLIFKKKMYIIWHDNDYDFALWVYENTILKDMEDVFIRQIPKNNSANLLKESFKDKADYHILPYIKMATPDILIQKVCGNESKMIVATEFMTQTPQHDHVFQRFERIYCISRERVPVAFVLPFSKRKLEKGNRTSYTFTSYKTNPLAVHTYLKTSIKDKNPTLIFFWPEVNGFLKYDKKHQTAPKAEGQIISWLNFINESIKLESSGKLLKSSVVKRQFDYMLQNYKINGQTFDNISFEDYIQNVSNNYKLTRVKIVPTEDAIIKYGIETEKAPSAFSKRKKTIIFKYDSKTLRATPYCGFACAFLNLFCYNNEGSRVNNLIFVPTKINYNDVSTSDNSKSPTFEDMTENLNKCPIENKKNLSKCSHDSLLEHLDAGCVYSRSQQQRIFGTIPDVVVFKDNIYYNNCYD